MDKKAASQKLRELASDDEHRSKAARFRDVYDDVEAALSAGVSRERVRTELGRLGLQMTPATFYTTLSRIRRGTKTMAQNPVPRSSDNAAPIVTAPDPQSVTGKASTPSTTSGQSIAKKKSSVDEFFDNNTHDPFLERLLERKKK